MKELKLMVVDDDLNFSSTLTKILLRKGFAVLNAENGIRALELAREHAFDLILMDIKMPGMNGIDCLNQIRQIRPSAKVILMTAFFVNDFSGEAASRGAYAIIKKPIDINALIGMLTVAMSDD